MKTSRRSFVTAAGAAAAAPLVAAGAPPRRSVEAEIRKRAHAYAGQRYLTVDYYRIGRKLAYPLPLKDLSVPAVAVPSISDYPWATWMMWELEERDNALGYAADRLGDAAAATLVVRDLAALASWPAYRQYDMPDLSSGHCGRLMWTALRKWRRLPAATRDRLRDACSRHATDVLPYSRKHYGPVRTAADLLALPAPESKLANIPLIGTIGAALTAGAGGHPASEELNRLVAAVYLAILEMRSRGYTEGVAYDGYVLDFLADWLAAISPAERAPILTHPNFRQLLEQSYMLGAPGAMAEVAQLSDVEAREMPFHFSGQAKLAVLQPDPVRAWLIDSWPLSRMRANAMGALLAVPESRGAVPPAGALDAHYAAVLRSGWAPEDLAVAASCHNSQTGHMQNDNGTLVIGHKGLWIVSDPGYQQYARGAERIFTIGPAAHNYPVIDGANQSAKAAGRPLLDAPEAGLWRARLDLTRCYPARAELQRVLRTIWLAGRDTVVVADEIAGANVHSVAYWWHGHPDAAWYARNGWMLLHLAEADLWFHSPQAPLADRNIERQEGSRGQLTAAAKVAPAPPVVWWVFALGDAPPPVEPAENGRALRVRGRSYRV